MTGALAMAHAAPRVAATIMLMCWCVGCGAPASGDSLDESTGSSAQSITGQLTEATAYPEAVQVDMNGGGSVCSGAIIAPKVVLAAGHCVSPITVPGGVSTFNVTAPYNGHQVLHGTQTALIDFDGTGNTHDVGLYFLDTPAQLSASQCPVLAQKPLADGSMVIDIGSRKNGALPVDTLWVGQPHAVTSGQNCTYQYDYCSMSSDLEEGDSGGPDEVPGSMPHEIVSVNSANAGSVDVFGRVDLVYSWIEQQVQQHGGFGVCAGGSGGGSGSSGGGSSSGSSGSGSTGGGTSSGSSGASTSSSSSGGGNGATTSGGDGGWGAGSHGSGGCAVAAGVEPSRRTAQSLGVGALVFAAVRRRGTRRAGAEARKLGAQRSRHNA